MEVVLNDISPDSVLKCSSCQFCCFDFLMVWFCVVLGVWGGGSDGVWLVLHYCKHRTANCSSVWLFYLVIVSSSVTMEGSSIFAAYCACCIA